MTNEANVHLTRECNAVDCANIVPPTTIKSIHCASRLRAVFGFGVRKGVRESGRSVRATGHRTLGVSRTCPTFPTDRISTKVAEQHPLR